MFDILIDAKNKHLKPEAIARIEETIEYAIAGIAENRYQKNNDWKAAYDYAASYLSPDKNGEFITQLMKKEYPPILEINAKADITQIKIEHFKKLFKRKEPQAVLQGLTNLYRWRDNKDLTKWAKEIISELVMDYNMGVGPNGFCICPNCRTEVHHQNNIPCTDMNCPECNTQMLRKEVVTEVTEPKEPEVNIINEDEEEIAIDVNLDDNESPKPLEADEKTGVD